MILNWLFLTATSIARSKWLGLLSGSKLQSHCNYQGFTVLSKVRIGIVANNENDCRTPDTVLGVGGTNLCSLGTYSGNSGCYLPNRYNIQKIPADVSILIK